MFLQIPKVMTKQFQSYNISVTLILKWLKGMFIVQMPHERCFKAFECSLQAIGTLPGKKH